VDQGSINAQETCMASSGEQREVTLRRAVVGRGGARADVALPWSVPVITVTMFSGPGRTTSTEAARQGFRAPDASGCAPA
jgi:hypothetical protein